MVSYFSTSCDYLSIAIPDGPTSAALLEDGNVSGNLSLLRLLSLTLSILLLPSIGAARPRHWFTDKKWWLGEFFIAAAIGADAHSTVQRTGRQIEGNHLLGRDPSRVKVIGLATLSFGLQTTYYAACWHLTTGEDDAKGWRIVGYTAIPVTVVSIYGLKGAIHNYQLEFPKLRSQDMMIKVKK